MRSEHIKEKSCKICYIVGILSGGYKNPLEVLKIETKEFFLTP